MAQAVLDAGLKPRVQGEAHSVAASTRGLVTQGLGLTLVIALMAKDDLIAPCVDRTPTGARLAAQICFRNLVRVFLDPYR